jgi:acetylornithine/N-succinyldiaminopimelate aminotransferase
MKLFDVYPLYDVTPVRAKDVYVYDENETEYLDLYGGHAVISIGHSHPHYVKKIKGQLELLGFYTKPFTATISRCNRRTIMLA